MRGRTASSVELISTLQRLDSTAVIRPTTTSPTSPMYLYIRKHFSKFPGSFLSKIKISPRFNWLNQKKIVNLSDVADHRGILVILCRVDSMTALFKKKIDQTIK